MIKTHSDQLHTLCPTKSLKERIVFSQKMKKKRKNQKEAETKMVFFFSTASSRRASM